MYNKKEKIIFGTVGVVFIVVAAIMYFAVKVVYASILTLLCLGTGMFLSAFISKKVFKRTIERAQIIYINSDGDIIKEGTYVDEADVEKLEGIFRKRADFGFGSEFEFYDMAFVIYSNKKKTKLYFNKKDLKTVRVSRFFFEIILNPEETFALQNILLKYKY